MAVHVKYTSETETDTLGVFKKLFGPSWLSDFQICSLCNAKNRTFLLLVDLQFKKKYYHFPKSVTFRLTEQSEVIIEQYQHHTNERFETVRTLRIVHFLLLFLMCNRIKVLGVLLDGGL